MSTASTKLQVVQVKALPPGTNAYEKQRAVILARLTVKVPSDLILPPSLIADPPNDVSSIPTTCGLLTDREIEITENYNAVDLARSIASKDLSAVEVTRAFAKRAIIAHQLTCCLTQLFMDEALERAKELDKYLEQHGKPIGPFHGVPISIKEHIPVAGTYSSQGSLASTVFNENDSHMVKILREAGAVFYCKTNQPQAIMHLESTSHFGRTLNPFNIKLSAGGSTGGEAALVAMKGSVLGPLKIGLIENDGFIIPQPPVQRAVEWAKTRLNDPEFASLLQVKPFQPYNAEEAWRKIRRTYWPQGGSTLKAALQESGEPVMPLTEHVCSDAEPFGMLTAEDVNQLRFERDHFRHAFADHWREQDVDVVIGPAFVGPASAHDTAFYWTYTSLYNFVDYPGVVFPTPIRAKSDEAYPEKYKPLSTECDHVRKLWGESDFEGAPINLQMVARRHQDNLLFGALATLKSILDLA
ncbi:hypothetical protein N0V87_000158 [Didymella glomerata]|uniref:Amidase domain-containing protein n=1 Tax=Didymella glomerata TaxID=749621 RepID=A0A9W9C5R9_9PLEO|nr:hypothetical protein N0V87_000158 [Didymella glomerata]